MQVLNGEYEIIELDNDYIFERSKRIIRKYLYNSWFAFKNYEEDIIQECALLFYGKLIHSYKPALNVTIWQYLKVCYRRKISKFLKTQKQTQYSVNYDDLKYKLFSTDLHNWEIEFMPFSQYLTIEQLKICELILHGYNYTEICDKVCPNNRTQDKQRPIYRRMVKIKQTLAKFYEIQYAAPDCTGNIKRSERAYQRR